MKSVTYDHFVKPVEVFMDRLRGISSTSLSPAVIDAIKFDGSTPIGQVANTFKQAHAIIVQCSEPIAQKIAKALSASGFNCYASSPMHAVVTVPKPSGEDRREMEIHIGKLAEEARVAVRNIRRKVRKLLPDVPEREVNEVSDMAIKRIDKIAREKLDGLT